MQSKNWNQSRRLSRRNVLGVIGLGAASAVLAACAPAATPTTAPAAAPTAAPAAPTTAPVTAKPVAPASTSTTQGVGLIKGPYNGESNQLTGAGATFPAVLYTKWFSEYNKLTGVEVNYQAIGSGGGIKAISDATVDFGGTDGPMTDEQLAAAKNGTIFHIPASLGAVVPTYNIPGITTSLRFTPETLSGIFLGTIKKWDDPKLKADNPDVNLPSNDILVVHRSDGSGTTYIWVDYLSTISQEWETKVGRGTSVNWPVGLGGKGNQGVTGEVKQNPYSIGYVELIYAVQNKLEVGQVKNQAGKFVTPELDSVTAAAEGITQSIAPDLRASIVDAPGEAAYPVSGFTWFLAYENMIDRPKAVALTRMMWWAIHDAQAFASELGYAPLPEGIVKKTEEKILAIKTDGVRAFPGQ